MAEKAKESKRSVLISARRMPHNLDAEQAVLGCMLIDNNAAAYIIQELHQDYFYSEAHQLIFEAMHSIMSRPDINNILDVITLTDELERLGNLQKVGGVQYISSLASVVPTSANFKKHCEIVKSKALLRKIIETCSNAVEQAYDNDDAEQVLANTESVLYDISKSQERKELVNVKELTVPVLKKLDELKDPASRAGIPTGYVGIDSVLNGLHPSDLILIAARPGVGKTALAMNIMSNIALNEGRRVTEGQKPKLHCAVFSLEMSKEQLMQRLICSVGGVSMTKASRGELSAEEWARVFAATKKLDDCELYIDDSSFIRPQDILNKCLRMRKERGLDVVMIDYLQLITPNKIGDETRAQQVADITRFLKITAKELNVPILLLSQLSRKSEERKSAPQLSDLRESGAIEQDADIVMFIHRPNKDEEIVLSSSKPQEIELHIAKHRNGRTGMIKMIYQGEFVRFYDALD
ncbi:MAG TPA: replicative DNA helicase [Clostridia bacterium]